MIIIQNYWKNAISFLYLHLLLCVDSVFLMKLFRVVYEYRIETLFGANRDM